MIINKVHLHISKCSDMWTWCVQTRKVAKLRPSMVLCGDVLRKQNIFHDLRIAFLLLGFLLFFQSPTSMKSVLQAGWLLTVAFGNVIVLIVAQAAPLVQVWNRICYQHCLTGFVGNACKRFYILLSGCLIWILIVEGKRAIVFWKWPLSG